MMVDEGEAGRREAQGIDFYFFFLSCPVIVGVKSKRKKHTHRCFVFFPHWQVSGSGASSYLHYTTLEKDHVVWFCCKSPKRLLVMG